MQQTSNVWFLHMFHFYILKFEMSKPGVQVSQTLTLIQPKKLNDLHVGERWHQFMMKI